MLDLARGWVALFAGQPAILGAVLGTVAAQALGILLELYYIPAAWTPRRQKQVIIPILIFGGWLFTVALWGWLLPGARLSERSEFALPTSLATWLIYPPIGRWITKHFPQVGSAWSAENDGATP